MEQSKDSEARLAQKAAEAEADKADKAEKADKVEKTKARTTKVEKGRNEEAHGRSGTSDIQNLDLTRYQLRHITVGEQEKTHASSSSK